ncbi:GNAT family N-acetyltransferase [Microbacterium indicum]|uniref:GNAT family N-acetyltransferase n=1 Tax=Microbacterium indicum TaxID=358100 RepID=UPI000406101F|nr:GNAT family N-acetyltransferase [Microbacterium indicum]
MATPSEVRVAPLADVPPTTLYDILRLRVDVFVVEQECAYPELDGRDVEPEARLLWVADEEGVAATARFLRDGDDARIGRVATAARARGRGLAGVLIRSAVDLAGGRTIRLDAQAHLEGWYASFGFAASGPQFLEDGIPHVPMIRAAA